MSIILIADDHPMTRWGVKFSFKNHFGLHTVIHEAENGDEVIELCKLHQFDMVLMDLNMPQTDAQNVVQTLIAMRPAIRILVLTMNKEELFGPLFLKLGAKGFLPKESGEPELLKAASAVMKGEIYLREDMKHFYKGRTERDDPYKNLTKRELEIVRHLANGASIGQVARILNLSSNTISTHKANIFRKLQLNSLVDIKSLTDIYPL